jgi:AbrB family looped-hinge helix DNA binding protein
MLCKREAAIFSRHIFALCSPYSNFAENGGQSQNVVHFSVVILFYMVQPKETRATEKGQIVIPAELRKKYGIKKGTRIQISEKNGYIVLNPLSPEVIKTRIEKLRGIIKGGPSMTKELEAERAQDLEIEERKFERWSRLR